MINKVTKIVFSVFLLITSLYGASFDCKKASTFIEHTICNDSELSKLDEELASSYKKIWNSLSDKTDLKKDQFDWLKNTRDKCMSLECLKTSYINRVLYLTNYDKRNVQENIINVTNENQKDSTKEAVAIVDPVQKISEPEMKKFDKSLDQKHLERNITKYDKSLVIFKNYYYGQSIQDFSLTEYSDCSEEMGIKSLCKNEEIEFLGDKYELVLNFLKDTLLSVGLAKEYSLETYIKLVGSMPHNGVNLVSLQNENNILDLFHLSKSNNKSTFISKIDEFERLSLANGNLIVNFLEIDKNDYKKYNNTTEAFTKMPKKSRFVQLIVSEDEGSSYLALVFSLPKINMELKELIKEQF